VVDQVVSAADEMSQVICPDAPRRRDLVGSVDETAYCVSRLDSFLQDMTRSGKDWRRRRERQPRRRVRAQGLQRARAGERALIVSVKEAGAAVDDLGRWSEEVGKIIEVIRTSPMRPIFSP